MTATPQDVQTKLDAATTALTKTTVAYPSLVKNFGTDWTKWPTNSNWYVAFRTLAAARTELGQLTPTPAKLAAAFKYKEV